MKVAFVVWRAPVVSEVFIYHQMRALQKQGVEVSLHSIDASIVPSHTAAIDPELVPRIILHSKFPSALRLYSAISQFGLFKFVKDVASSARFATRLRSESQRNVSALFLYRQFRETLNWLVHADYDLIHCQFFSLVPRLVSLQKAGLLSRNSAIPIVCSLRGGDICVYANKLDRRTLKDYSNKISLFLSNSDFLKEIGRNKGLEGSKIETFLTGIDTKLFKRKSCYGDVSETSKSLVYVGRLHEKKGTDMVLRAFAIAQQQIGDISLTMIGDGELRDSLQALVLDLNIQHLVSFKGWLPQSAIKEQLEDALLFLCGSQIDRDDNADGPVNTIKEALAMEVPVVTTSSGGIPELGLHRKAGIEVPERNTTAFAQAIIELLTSPETRIEYSRNARLLITERCELTSATQVLLSHYRSTLND